MSTRRAGRGAILLFLFCFCISPLLTGGGRDSVPPPKPLLINDNSVGEAKRCSKEPDNRLPFSWAGKVGFLLSKSIHRYTGNQGAENKRADKIQCFSTRVFLLSCFLRLLDVRAFGHTWNTMRRSLLRLRKYCCMTGRLHAAFQIMRSGGLNTAYCDKCRGER